MWEIFDQTTKPSLNHCPDGGATTVIQSWRLKTLTKQPYVLQLCNKNVRLLEQKFSYHALSWKELQSPSPYFSIKVFKLISAYMFFLNWLIVQRSLFRLSSTNDPDYKQILQEAPWHHDFPLVRCPGWCHTLYPTRYRTQDPPVLQVLDKSLLNAPHQAWVELDVSEQGSILNTERRV